MWGVRLGAIEPSKKKKATVGRKKDFKRGLGIREGNEPEEEEGMGKEEKKKSELCCIPYRPLRIGWQERGLSEVEKGGKEKAGLSCGEE